MAYATGKRTLARQAKTRPPLAETLAIAWGLGLSVGTGAGTREAARCPLSDVNSSANVFARNVVDGVHAAGRR